MIHRAVTETILKNLTVFPAANIIGPRQVGKTTLAKHLQTLLGKALYLPGFTRRTRPGQIGLSRPVSSGAYR